MVGDVKDHPVPANILLYIQNSIHSRSLPRQILVFHFPAWKGWARTRCPWEYSGSPSGLRLWGCCFERQIPGLWQRAPRTGGALLPKNPTDFPFWAVSVSSGLIFIKCWVPRENSGLENPEQVNPGLDVAE